MADHDLSRISTQVETSPRRPGRRDFLTIGAAAAAIVTGVKVPPSMAAVANSAPIPFGATPVRKAIAEYQVAAEAHQKAQSLADGALYEAFPDPMTRLEEDRPAEVQRLYDEADRLYRAMDTAYDRVIATPCTSLGDCIAVLEWGGDGDVETVVDAVLPCLRRLGGAA
jgi:hypothetical protein